jgi:hypothetical protein
MRAQLRKPGACGVFSLQVKYDPASRLKCIAALIIDDIQYSRKSCHDEYDSEVYNTNASGECQLLHSHPSQIDKTTLIKNLLDFSRSRA